MDRWIEGYLKRSQRSNANVIASGHTVKRLDLATSHANQLTIIVDFIGLMIDLFIRLFAVVVVVVVAGFFKWFIYCSPLQLPIGSNESIAFTFHGWPPGGRGGGSGILKDPCGFGRVLRVTGCLVGLFLGFFGMFKGHQGSLVFWLDHIWDWWSLVGLSLGFWGIFKGSWGLLVVWWDLWGSCGFSKDYWSFGWIIFGTLVDL